MQVTEYNTPAWTYDATRKQWYYHSYLPDYPDLNLRNDAVVKELDVSIYFFSAPYSNWIHNLTPQFLWLFCFINKFF